MSDTRKNRLGDDPLAWIKDSRQRPAGVQLSDISFISPAELKPNPLNRKFFTDEEDEYNEKLQEDIKERGIIVPLIARKDGTLLSGHRRKTIADNLQLASVPVQYVEKELDSKKEAEFVIKDNLLRRQLPPVKRLELYKALYENFDERIMMESRGGDRKSEQAATKGENSLLIDTEEKQKPLTAEVIAKDTGQNIETIKKDLKKIRTEIKGAPAKPKEQKHPAELYKKPDSGLKGVLDWKNDRIRKEIVIFFEDTETQERVYLGIRTFFRENNIPFTRGKI